MLRAGGYAALTDRETGQVKEADTFTCHHCQRIVIVKPGCDPVELGGHCKLCDELICPRCYGLGKCTPWEKQMELMEARERLYEAIRF